MNENTNEQLNTDFEQDGLQFEELDYDENLRWSEDADEMPQYHSDARSYIDSNAERVAQIAVAEAKEEEDEERRKRVIGFFKIMSLMVVAFVVLIFAVIAWFAMNKNVTSNGMAVMAADTPFEIATRGDSVRLDTVFTTAESSFGYGDNTVLSGYYLTDNTTTQIKVRYTPSADDLTEFGPGSSGLIEFYVIPKRAGDLTVTINLDLVGYRSFNSDATIMKVSELTTTNSGLEQSVIDQYNLADSFLDGHILFFEEPGDISSTTQEANRYYYKKPITTRSFTKTFTNVSANSPQLVQIYWMWPETLGQIALKNNTSELRMGYPIVQDTVDDGTDISATDKGKLIQYLIDNKAMVFADTTNIQASTINNAKIESNYNLLSDEYNNADLAIGSSINYFMIDISVTPGSEE